MRVAPDLRLGNDPPALPPSMRAQAEPHIARSQVDPDNLVAIFQEGRVHRCRRGRLRLLGDERWRAQSWSTPIAVTDSPGTSVFNAAIAASPDCTRLTVSFYDQHDNRPGNTTYCNLYPHNPSTAERPGSQTSA